MKLDILAFGAHPDDVEMSCGGTLALSVAQGKKVGIVDLTRGEMGTLGSASLREKEAKKAAQILGIDVRHNLKLKDTYINNDADSQYKIIQLLRKYKPDTVLCNSTNDRHPDHSKGAQLVRDAFFFSGLSKRETTYQAKPQLAWRPFHLFHYIQDMEIDAHFYINISDYWETKKKLILAYSSQFYTPNSAAKKKETYISTASFMEAFDARYRYYGKKIGVSYAEPFSAVKPLGMQNFDFLIHKPF